MASRTPSASRSPSRAWSRSRRGARDRTSRWPWTRPTPLPPPPAPRPRTRRRSRTCDPARGGGAGGRNALEVERPLGDEDRVGAACEPGDNPIHPACRPSPPRRGSGGGTRRWCVSGGSRRWRSGRPSGTRRCSPFRRGRRRSSSAPPRRRRPPRSAGGPRRACPRRRLAPARRSPSPPACSSHASRRRRPCTGSSATCRGSCRPAAGCLVLSWVRGTSSPSTTPPTRYGTRQLHAVRVDPRRTTARITASSRGSRRRR